MKQLRIILIVTLAMVFSASIVFSEPPIRVLKASPKSPPEMQKEEKKAKEKIPKPREKKLTRKELEEKLMNLPGEREKLQKIKKGFKPKSSVIGEREFSLSSLNPFSASDARAQSAVSVTLDYKNNFRRYPNPWANFFYTHNYYWTSNPYISTIGNIKGFAYIYFQAPHSGLYIINVYAYYKRNAILRHYAYGVQQVWQTVASWSAASLPSSNWNDYITIQYLAAGDHYFQWRPDPANTQVARITIDSY